MTRHYSKPYKYNGKIFIYDYDASYLLWVGEMQEQFRDICEEVTPGYFLIDEIGFHKDHWDNKEVRDEYLYEWCAEIDERNAEMLENIREEFPECLE